MDEKENKKKETTLEDIRKGLIINRVLSLITILLFGTIIVAGVIGYIKVKAVVEEVEPIVDQVMAIDFESIQKIDFDSLQNTVNEINVFVGNTDFDALSNTIESIPADIFVQIDNIQNYLGQIASLTDMKEDMATAMENLDNLTKMLSDFQTSMAPVLKFFGK